MASIRLIAQYPNVGNSGHIFLVPTGQKEKSLGVGEKINTEMLSIRHAKSVSSDFNSSEIIDSSLIQGENFLAVSVPIKQVLNEKSSIRLSHVWMAIEGFNVASNETIFPKLYLELQLLIPKLEAVVLKLGHLEPNVSRYIEVDEMVEWSQNPVFLSVNDLCEPIPPTSSVKVPVYKKEIVNKSGIYFDPIAKKLVAIAGAFVVVVFVVVIFVASNQFSVIKIPPKNKPNHKLNEIVTNDFNSELKKVFGEVDENDIKLALDVFGIKRDYFESCISNKKWMQVISNTDNFINSKKIGKILDIINADIIGRIELQDDGIIELLIKSNNTHESSVSDVKKNVAVINGFLEKLRSLKCNKIASLLIKEKRWSVDGKFIIDFVNNSDIVVLKNQSGDNNSSFSDLDDIIKNSNGLSKRFENLIEDAKSVGKGTKGWYSLNDINTKFKECLSELNKP
jgi:hypothetical protein